MAGTTVPLAFPYPTGPDLLAGVDEAIKSLAEAVDDYLVGSSAALVAGANVNVGTSALYRRGTVAVLSVQALTATAAIAGAAVIATVPVGYRPAAQVRGMLWNFTTNAVVLVEVFPNGNVQTAMAIANGNAIYGSMVLPL